MKVKICGIKDSETGKQAALLGADSIGFVFAESRRRIDIETAREIIKNLPPEIMKVGVFVNESKEMIEKTVSYTGLTHIQLHGDEDPDFCKSLSLPVIKAISIRAESDFNRISKYSCEYILLDSIEGPFRGGNGTSFNWKLVQGKKLSGKKVILAGGLHAENLKQAIAIVCPFMVDVSSGVETNGKKDLEKIKAFIQAAKGGREEHEIIHNA